MALAISPFFIMIIMGKAKQYNNNVRYFFMPMMMNELILPPYV